MWFEYVASLQNDYVYENLFLNFLIRMIIELNIE